MNNLGVLYEVSTGAVRRAYRLPKGMDVASEVTVPAGHGLLVGVYTNDADCARVIDGALVSCDPPAADIAALRIAAKTQIDSIATGELTAAISIGHGRAMIYMAKEKDAAAILADPSPTAEAYPLAAAELGITGDTLTDIATVWQSKAAAWKQFAAANEGVRLAAKQAVEAATDQAAIDAVINGLVWPTLEE